MTASGSSRPRRVLVIGPGGAGKTTVAQAMAKALDLPLVHLGDVRRFLDELHRDAYAKAP